MTLDEIDKTGLIREAYRIEGITPGECRSIFTDWAIRLPAGIMPQEAIATLLDSYGGAAPEHPMSAILRAGLQPPARPVRRGGRRPRTGGT
ncbi:MAG: hypothetical protein GY717_19485 [Rhodobacteraceae bacterium]|nr:hypothetical protein [Paracoccaceae bacterium]